VTGSAHSYISVYWEKVLGKKEFFGLFLGSFIHFGSSTKPHTISNLLKLVNAQKEVVI